MPADDRAAPLRYIAAALPGWFAATALAYGLHRWAGVSGWVAFIIPTLWIALDAILYPWKRRYYETEPPWRWLVGERGIALTPLEPDGLVRVRSEIWRARVADGLPPIAQASEIRVRRLEGLCVIVEPEATVRG